MRSAASALWGEVMKVAGIDVHKKVLMVVVLDAITPEEKAVRRRFVTMPSELHRLLTWLPEQGVEEAVTESTAQYWRSVWLELEPHMRLHLAQAFSNRLSILPGRWPTFCVFGKGWGFRRAVRPSMRTVHQTRCDL
jgi:hypothetical protein